MILHSTLILLLSRVQEVMVLPSQARGWEQEACRTVTAGDRYTCTREGRIQCKQGWIGDLCQVPMCGNECDPQHGYCKEPGQCKCNLGYHGDSCRECVKLPGCQNGYCRKSFECRCEEGYSGIFCSTTTCPEDCEKNNGFCSQPGKCECKRGYQGENCDQCSAPTGCLHGRCDKPLECLCEAGWEGPLCDQPVCGPDCDRLHGECWKPGQCRCKVGYQGDGCDQCVPYPGCVNGGCEEPYQCNCLPGWRGRLCDQPEVEVWGLGLRLGRCQPLDTFICMNGGTDFCRYTGKGQRVGEPECVCREGFSGIYCQVVTAIEPRNSDNSFILSGNTTQHKQLETGDSSKHEQVETENSAKHEQVETEDTSKYEKLVTKNSSKDKQVQSEISSKQELLESKNSSGHEQVENKSSSLPSDEETSDIQNKITTSTSISSNTMLSAGSSGFVPTEATKDWSKKSDESPLSSSSTSSSSAFVPSPEDSKSSSGMLSASRDSWTQAIHSDLQERPAFLNPGLGGEGLLS